MAAHETWDREATIGHLVRKAGCLAPCGPALRAALRVTRYQSTKCTLSYEEYRVLRHAELGDRPVRAPLSPKKAASLLSVPAA